MTANSIKANGVHYTPSALAEFLASVTIARLSGDRQELRILDPACGDGALLFAIAAALPEKLRRRTTLVGYETDPLAIEQTERLLQRAGVEDVSLIEEDFLAAAGVDALSRERQGELFDEPAHVNGAEFDLVIANPPYVRTQILGSVKSRDLARRFQLTGRVDLYHAFTKAMTAVLKTGGVLGLLTSNRFLTVKSGESLRQLLRSEFDLRAIYDLGDTKLFSAAVLPVIVVATRGRDSRSDDCSFDRVYEQRGTCDSSKRRTFGSVLDAIRQPDVAGSIRTPGGQFRIERGQLNAVDRRDVWSLTNPEYDRWLKSVRQRTAFEFEDVAQIRVGIKTTADEVFIRDDSGALPIALQPERELIKPLITHHDARRWRADSAAYSKTVLYPYRSGASKRVPIALERFAGGRGYLESHRKRLTKRRYVIEGGREWFEIWVPHNPADWSKPKLVFPDISEQPRFFRDDTGAIVNGDCYWITLKDGVAANWLLLMLAVANSTFITRFYDIAFHNKLYSGRRRFMTQYVKKFPLPDIARQDVRRIVKLAAAMVRKPIDATEQELDRLVWKAFGLVEEIGG